MRKRVKYILISLLLAGGVLVCVIRWQAWFGMPPEPEWTGDTIHYTFPTFNPTQEWLDTLSPGSLDFIVLGDIHNRLHQADYDSLAARVPHADAVIQIGDWLDRGYPYYYQMLLREWTPSALEGLPVITCAGNHEYSKGIHKCLAPEWTEWFPQPIDSRCSVPGVFYTLDFEGVRFIVLDTNPLGRLVYMTRAQTWLQAAIKGAGGRRVVVLMHHPVFSAAKGRSNPRVYASFRHTLRQADLVIAGHDHSYANRWPFVVLNTAGKPKAQREAVANGESVECSSTEPVYSVLTFPSTEAKEKGSFLFRTYRLSDGVLIDSVYVKHD